MVAIAIRIVINKCGEHDRHGMIYVLKENERRVRDHGHSWLRSPAGDYMYRSGNIHWDVELGIWGIMRVLGEPGECLTPLLNPVSFGVPP